jgi:hypothetical protein
MITIADLDKLYEYTGYYDDGRGYNVNYCIYVNNPVLDIELYKDVLDKTQICYKNQILNREYLELPIYLSKSGRSPCNYYSQMLSLMTTSYPVYTNPDDRDHILEKEFKYNITIECQNIHRYIKSIQDKAKVFIENRDGEYVYKIKNNNIEFRDYADMAEFALKEAGLEACESYIIDYIGSDWFYNYTPNAWVDVEKVLIHFINNLN